MNIRHSLVTIGCFVGFTAGGYWLSTLLQPQNAAYAGSCVGTVDGVPGNVCDRDIVMALCRDTGGFDHRRDPCVTQTLPPQARFTARLETRVTGTPYTMACNAPYVPAWKPGNSNPNIFNQGCRKPG